ncbi:MULTISPECIES: IclR family transcriptional regulator [unclassified Microbacterium]|uniref:IclR family transcriptional regulator n=1 Tax=unclassified Microbacterium TaxID=2609290 RepID=UPI00214CE3AB|nr:MULTISPECIES: IclR family transcriptional regulator [unclassified Microbacterium]MCR2808407.1 IclR family transcriptional regulator [Microbacterium sp. zg.B185]WIM19147.1 IclR family transcriptional regulator [Microbacterium sp. zg-B185]
MTLATTDESVRELTAAGRVLAVLDVFRSCPGPLTLSEISREAGLSMTTTHRLAHELLAWQALERTADGRYQLGTKLLEIVTASGSGMRLRERALPWLVRLHQMLRGLVVHLAVRDSTESVYLEALRSGYSTVGMNRLGGRMPLHVTPTGLVLLAYADEETQRKVLEGPLRAFTPITVTDPEVLRGELTRIRECGTVITQSQVTIGTGGVAAPVFDGEGRVIAAVGIVVSLKDHRPEEYVSLVKATANKISQALDAARRD